MRIVHLSDISSTNDYLLRLDTEETLAVFSDFQSAGRGMGSNHWESAAGQNLLFSVLLHPVWLSPAHQFVLSMANALALCDLVKFLGVPDVRIKWPNDIYVGDGKVAGTLIETALSGQRIAKMVIGTGLNLNQRCFLSDAPNPVSVSQFIGHDCNREKALEWVLQRLTYYLELAEREHTVQMPGGPIPQLYHQRLYRADGLHPYEDCNGRFRARLDRVETNGTLVLITEEGEPRRYAVKEVKFIL